MTGRLVRVVIAAAALALIVAGSAAAAPWEFHQTDGDRCWDVSTRDWNNNGWIDDSWFDVDNDCRLDTRIWNSVGGDGLLESMTFDMNEDGRWEYWLADNNQRVGFDVAYFDDDADGYYDRWAYLPQAAPDTSLGSILGAIQNDTSVGGTPQRSGAFGLVVYLSNFTRTSVWAPPDSDNDGRPNGIDRYPYDPTR